jgi:hypothetical protein
MNLLLFWINHAQNYISLLFLGGLIWGIVYISFMKFFEVRIKNEEIFISNLYKTRKYPISEFQSILNTTFSPLVMKISMKDNQRFLFLLSLNDIIKYLFIQGRTKFIEDLKNKLTY